MEVNFGAVRKQQLRYVCGIGDGRAMQGGQTPVLTLILHGIDVCAVVEQESRDRHLILLGGVIEQRLVRARTVVDVGSSARTDTSGVGQSSRSSPVPEGLPRQSRRRASHLRI